MIDRVPNYSPPSPNIHWPIHVPQVVVENDEENVKKKRVKKYGTSLEKLHVHSKVFCISSFVPRKCGIATFAHDLTHSMDTLNPSFQVQIAALEANPSEIASYPSNVKFRIQQDTWSDYEKVVRYINSKRSVNVVCLQHEFGIFGKNDGEIVLPFVAQIKKPIITTFHTVLQHPTERQKKIISALAKQSAFVIVMQKAAIHLLTSIYGVMPEKIMVIPHGVPDFAEFQPLPEKKEKITRQKKLLMTSINLLSEPKGIEYAIESLPLIVKKFPHFLYRIVGQTHPVLLQKYGGKDVYRQKLMALIKKLGVEKHVQFVDRYVSLREVLQFIMETDFYITPYIDPQQAASGALAYAIGAGKVCISTPYLYAKEMLSHGTGILVPFQNGTAIAKAIIRIITHPEKRVVIEERASERGKTMTWVHVAYRYLELTSIVLLAKQKHFARVESEAQRNTKIFFDKVDTSLHLS